MAGGWRSRYSDLLEKLDDRFNIFDERERDLDWSVFAPAEENERTQNQPQNSAAAPKPFNAAARFDHSNPVTIPALALPAPYRFALVAVMLLCASITAAPFTVAGMVIFDLFVGAGNESISSSPASFYGGFQSMTAVFLSVFFGVGAFLAHILFKISNFVGLMLAQARRRFIDFLVVVASLGAVVALGCQAIQSQVKAFVNSNAGQSGIGSLTDLNWGIVLAAVILGASVIVFRFGSTLLGFSHRFYHWEIAVGAALGVPIAWLGARYQFGVAEYAEWLPQFLTGVGLVLVAIALIAFVLERAGVGYK